MTSTAMEFSRLGDESFDAFAACLPQASRRRLALEQPIAPDTFQQIREAAAAYLAASLGRDCAFGEPELLEALLAPGGAPANYTAGGTVLPMKEQAAQMSLLHKRVASLFESFRIERHVTAIDLPFNVRLVYGKTDPARARQPFASTKLHSDVWAGVPVDAVVVVLPLFGDIEHITIELGEMPRELELSSMRPLGAYDELSGVPMAVPYDVALRHGFVYFADARLLHRTVKRRDSGVRLSIDFRFQRPAGRLREMAPDGHGPDGMNSTVSYRDWLDVGTRSGLEFDRSIHDLVAAEGLAESSPIQRRAHRLVPL